MNEADPEAGSRSMDEYRRRRVDAWARRRGLRSQLIQPTAWFFALVATLQVVGLTFQATHFPFRDSAWVQGQPAWWIYNVVGVTSQALVVVLAFLLARALTRRQHDLALAQHCRSIARYACTTVPLPADYIGVHVWAVEDLRFWGVPHWLSDLISHGKREPKGRGRLTRAPFLRRRAAFIPERRLHPPLRFLGGKGVIGLCWELEREVVLDLEPLHGPESAAEFYGAFSYDQRLRLSWRQWWNTRQFHAIWAYPLHGGPAGSREFIGCVSFDVQRGGHLANLHKLVDVKEPELESLLWDCAAVLSEERRH